MNAPIDTDQIRTALTDLRPRMQRFAFGLCGSSHDADDLVQAGYERALTRLHQWQRGTRLDSWMYRIIQSIHFNEVRFRRNRRTESSDRLEEFHASADTSAEALGQITLERVRDCVARLPDEHRSCLLLIAVEGLSYKEAASVLEIPLGTLTSRLSRARSALQQMMERTTGRAP